MKKIICFLLLLIMLLTICACKPKIENTGEIIDGKYTEHQVAIDVSPFSENAVFKVSPVLETLGLNENLPLAVSVMAYDICVTQKGIDAMPNGSVEVSFPIPNGYDSTIHEVAVYYILEDGALDKKESLIVGQTVVTKLDRFGAYVVAIETKEPKKFTLVLEGSGGSETFDINKSVEFEFMPGETWENFIKNNSDKGFSYQMDYFNEKKVVCYNYKNKVMKLEDLLSTEITISDIIDDTKVYKISPAGVPKINMSWVFNLRKANITLQNDDRVFTGCYDEISITEDYKYTLKTVYYNMTDHFTPEETIRKGVFTATKEFQLGTQLNLNNGYVIKSSIDNRYEISIICNGTIFTGYDIANVSLY